jgi:HD-like signal output (HDOD) protein
MNTPAASAQTSASLPHLIEKLLQQQAIEYQLRPTPLHIPESQQVQACLLCDSNGTALRMRQRLELGLNYLAGLLHNFGYLVLAYIFPPYFHAICRHQEANPHVQSHLIDQHLLGVSRDQIGSWLMRFWDMPVEISTAIRYQHDAQYAGDDHVYANLVYLAQALLQDQNIGGGAPMPIPESLLARLELSAEDASKVVHKILNARDVLRTLTTQYQQG